MRIMGITDRNALRKALALVEEMEQELASATGRADSPHYAPLLRQHDTALANLLFERGAEILTAPAYATVASAIYNHVRRCEDRSDLPSKLTEGALRITQTAHAYPITPIKLYPRGRKVSFVASIQVQELTDEAERARMIQLLSEAHITYLLTQSQYGKLIIRLYGEESTLPALTVAVTRNRITWEAHRAGGAERSLLGRSESLFGLLFAVIPEAGPLDRRKEYRSRARKRLVLPTRSLVPNMSMSLLDNC